MYGKMNDTDDHPTSFDADNTASQLIDSYFLPGGILDPEDAAANMNIVEESDRSGNGGMHPNRYDFSDHDSAEHARRNLRRDVFPQPSSSLDYGHILPQRHIPSSSGEDNSAATLSTGVGALDPNKDEVVFTTGIGSRYRHGQLHSNINVPSSYSQATNANVASQTHFFDSKSDFVQFHTTSSLSVEATSNVTNPPKNNLAFPNVKDASSRQAPPETMRKSPPTDYDWHHRPTFSNPSRASVSVRDVYPSHPSSTKNPAAQMMQSSSASDEFTSLFDAIQPIYPMTQQVPSSSHTRTSASDESGKINSNPWSHDDLVTLPMAAKSQQSRYDFDLNIGNTTMDRRTNRDGNFNTTSHDHEPSLMPTRTPPGFHSSSHFNKETNNDRNGIIGSRSHLQSTQPKQQTYSKSSPSQVPSQPIQPMNYSRVVNQNIPSTYDHMHSQDQSSNQRHHGGRIPDHSSSHSERRQIAQDHRPQYKHSTPVSSPIRKKSYTALQSSMHHDVDYEFQSISRNDVPSTIYVEEDAISNSEDTLTVCADSVTVASVPQNRAERFDMDVVEETSLTEQKKSKIKRNKKKKQKKQLMHESVKSRDDSAENQSDDATHESQDDNEHDDDKSHSHNEEHDYSSKHSHPQSKLIKRHHDASQQAISRGSAATTAVSSSVTHNAATKLGKKKGATQERKISKDVKHPRKPYQDIVIEWFVRVWPVVIFWLRRFVSSSVIFIKKSSKTCISCIPGKDKLWFMVPLVCIVTDFVFLVCAMITKILAKTTYFLVMFHKLALLELLESNSAAMCYSIIYFYPTLIRKVSEIIPIHEYEYAPGAIRWFFVQTYLLLPIQMEDTYLYKAKSLLASNQESLKSRMMKRLLPSTFVRTTTNTSIKIPLSDRVSMANYILSILRKVAPFVVALEVYIHRNGFLMYLTSTERILFGYGLSVLRTGYLFSPLIWISWTIQLTIIMFISPRNFYALDHCLFILGLVSIRLSHYTAALEDLEGTNAIHCNSTSPRRRQASYGIIR